MADNDEDDSSRRGPLIAMGVVHNSTRLEDCLVSGRTNCAPVETQETE
jgi:hypothetical protein